MTYDLLPREEGDELTEVSPGFTDRLMQRIDDYERRQRRVRVAAVALTITCLGTGGYLLSTRQMDHARKPAMAQRQPGPAATPPAVKTVSLQQTASPREPGTLVPMQHPAIARRQPGPAATPAVKAAPVQQAASSGDAVKPGTAVPAAAEGTAIAESQPGPVAMPEVKAVYVQRVASPWDTEKPGTPVTHPVGLAQPATDARARAGIRPGDVVITIDGKEVRGASLQAAAIQKDLDDCTPLRIELVRDGKPLTFTVQIARTGRGPCGAAVAPPP